MLTVWGRRSSFNLQKVMWLVGELQPAHRHIEAGGRFGGLDTPAFRAMNPHGKVPVQSDCFAICSTTKKPVLSHLFLNYLLDNGVAYENFVDLNGYQPPLTKLSAPYLIDQGFIPENLMNAVVLPEDFESGLTFYEVAPSTEALWRQSWSEFKAGG